MGLDNMSVGQIQKTLFDFEENPDLPSLNLESLHKGDFHSIRASRNLRIILHKLVAKEDTIWLVVYGGHHDEAYSWIEKRQVKYFKETQTYDILFVEGEEELPSATSHLPHTSINKLNNAELMALGVEPHLILKVRSIERQVDVNLLRDYLPEITADALELMIMGESYQEVLDMVKAGQVKANEEDVASILASPNNKRNIVQINRTDDLERYFSGDFKEWTQYLHPTQRILADRTFQGSVKVTGGAGTGKTIVALHRAKMLQENRRAPLPILFTTYNTNLAQNLEIQFKEMGISGKKVQLMNIHALVIFLAQKNRMIQKGQKIIGMDKGIYEDGVWLDIIKSTGIDYDVNFLKEEYEDIFLYYDIQEEEVYQTIQRIKRSRIKASDRPRVYGLIKAYRERLQRKGWIHPGELMNQLARHYAQEHVEKPFSHIIVDEVQDFGMPELRLIRNLTQEGENDLFLCGDPTQKIYNKKFSFRKAGIYITGRRSQTLKINYRTTEEIRLTAVKVIKGERFDDFEEESLKMEGYYSLYQGESPTYKLFQKEREERAYVAEEVKSLLKKGCSANEICICAFRRAELKGLIQALHRQNIPYFNLEEGLGSKSGVRISSFRSVKGMEFRAVILTGLSKGKIPYKFQGFNLLGARKKEEAIRAQKAALYVAITRARDVLIITGTGDRSDWIEVG